MTPPLAPSPAAEAIKDAAARCETMNALAGLLLDWRVDCERHLRSLTCMQRWLERIRSSDAADGERELLIQEIGRLLSEAPPKHDDWTRRAADCLNNLGRP